MGNYTSLIYHSNIYIRNRMAWPADYIITKSNITSITEARIIVIMRSLGQCLSMIFSHLSIKVDLTYIDISEEYFRFSCAHHWESIFPWQLYKYTNHGCSVRYFILAYRQNMSIHNSMHVFAFSEFYTNWIAWQGRLLFLSFYHAMDTYD